MRFPSATLLASTLLAASADARFVMYADQYHTDRPTNPADRVGIDHVVLAFAPAAEVATYTPYVNISTIRSEFPNAKVMIAVGGWGDDAGYMSISANDSAISKFAADVATMLKNTGADGVDIDWEYPGGDGQDYKIVPNSKKVYQIAAFPKVLAAIRASIGKKLLSIAVPGKKVDMIAYTPENGPKIWPSVDYINLMAYDFMNRRDNVTKHHTSVAEAEQMVLNYLAIGAPVSKMNLGFAYYAKHFETQTNCTGTPLGCPIVLAEDPKTGADLGTSGATTFETSNMVAANLTGLTITSDGTCGPSIGKKCANACCSQYNSCGFTSAYCGSGCQFGFGVGCTSIDLAGSWQTALKNGVTDQANGGQYYMDSANKIFWTWDTVDLINRKFEQIVYKYKLGGVMAWSLGEDTYDYSHIKAMAKGVAGMAGAGSPPKPKTKSCPPKTPSSTTLPNGGSPPPPGSNWGSYGPNYRRHAKRSDEHKA